MEWLIGIKISSQQNFIRNITFQIREKIANPQKRSFFQYSTKTLPVGQLQTGLIQSQEAQNLYKTARKVFLENENTFKLTKIL